MLFALLGLALPLSALADEGMWLPEQLPDRLAELESAGVAVSAADLADVRGGPLGAMVDLGHCSASFVSADGLLLTNGHCVRDYLRYASGYRGDLVRDGYVAQTPEDELWAGPSARAWVVESITDVTAEIGARQARLGKRATDGARHRAVEQARNELAAACEEGGQHRCRVVSFYGGGSYRLVKEKVFKDLRIVYAPPESVVFFGGAEDNWAWPRHAGDVAVLRVYSGPEPAYSDENRAFHPESSLRISTNGVSAGDPVLQAGFPGRTYRHRTGAELAHAATEAYPTELAIIDELADVLGQHAATGSVARQRVQNRIFWLGNRHKYLEGMVEGMARADVAGRAQSSEAELRAWVAADRGRQKVYGADLSELDAVIDRQLAGGERDQLLSLTGRTSSLLGAARSAWRLSVEREKPESERLEGYSERDVADLRDSFVELDADLYLPAERDMLAVLLARLWRLPAGQRGASYVGLVSAAGGVDQLVEQLFRQEPALASAEARVALLAADKATLSASSDPWMRLAMSLEKWEDELRQEADHRAGALARLRPVRFAALQEQNGHDVYPDANGTLRVSVGRVQGYSPAEAVSYGPLTSVSGMVAKSGEPPFALPERLVDAAARADKSAWAEPSLQSVPLDFLSTLDSTGGNSGSPTLNANGELVGVVFDRNYEAMAADWDFDPALNRSIHVDIRFGLWMLSEVEGAGWIVEALGQGGAADAVPK